MGRYSQVRVKERNVQRGQVHPVMRGIGCILIAIVPLLSYGVAVLLVNYGVQHGWPIPPNWLGRPTIPPLLLKLQGLQTVFAFIVQQTNLIANIIFAVALAVFIFGVLSILYGFLYRLVGPPQYGPTDAPPIRVKVKRYKR
jgi:hypothetical protein